MCKLFLSCVFVIFCLRNVEMHSYHLGSCPTIPPSPSLDMRRMLGIWYVIEKTITASSCIIYNITESDEPNEYKIYQVSQHFLLALTPLKHDWHYTGTLKAVDPAVPGRMLVKFPLCIAGTTSFTIFATDYDTYAGVFSCHKLTFAHRQSAIILSRRKTLDKMYIDKVRNTLSNNQIDPFELSIIKQTDCPKIEDGVEYVSHKVSDAYHKVPEDDAGATSYLRKTNKIDIRAAKF